jgi:uridylate kinase
MKHTTVISLGGSIVVPDKVDVSFVRSFATRMRQRLEADGEWRLALVSGGGATARRYQAAAREVDPECDTATLDWIGVAATRINAEVVRSAFGELAPDPVVTNPEHPGDLAGRVIVGGGWKPGFSTDNVSVRLAETLGARTLINLSNIAKVYTADPREDPTARPLDTVSWADFRRIVGEEWVPGKNTPFDPVATRRAAELSMTVIAADGRDLDNLDAILDGKAFTGTTIGPQ